MIKLQTRYCETAQDKIIHHPSYLIYMEEARIDYFKSVGLDINALEKKGIYCPLVDLTVKYLKALFSGQEIQVHVKLSSCSKVRFTLSYKILRGETCVATGLTTHCFVDKNFKPMAVLPQLAATFSA